MNILVWEVFLALIRSWILLYSLKRSQAKSKFSFPPDPPSTLLYNPVLNKNINSHNTCCNYLFRLKKGIMGMNVLVWLVFHSFIRFWILLHNLKRSQAKSKSSFPPDRPSTLLYNPVLNKNIHSNNTLF